MEIKLIDLKTQSTEQGKTELCFILSSLYAKYGCGFLDVHVIDAQIMSVNSKIEFESFCTHLLKPVERR